MRKCQIHRNRASEADWTVSLPLLPAPTGSAFRVLAYFEPDKFRLDKGELTHYNFKCESDKNWDTYFCPTCGTTVYHNLESWGPLNGINAGTLDPSTFWFDILGEVFTKVKAPFVGEIKAG